MKFAGLFKKVKAKNLFIWLCLYKISLDAIFLGIIVKIYDYYGFTGSFSWGNFFISWSVFIIFTAYLLWVIYEEFNRISSLIIFVLYIISFTPFCTLINYGVDPAFLGCNSLFWFILLVVNHLFLRHDKKRLQSLVEKPVNVSREKHRKWLLILLTLAGSGIILYISWKYTGFRISLSLGNVYELRSEARENSLGFLYYFFGWANAIILVSLGISLYKKHYLIAIFLTFIQVLNFSYNGMKTTLFLTLAVIVFCTILRRIKLHSIPKILLIIFILVNMASLAEYYTIGSWQLVNFFSFRTFLLPVKISEWFFDFFSTHEPDYFRTGFMGRLGFESPYIEYGIDYLISGLYFGNYESRANNGLISDAMTNLGFPGIFIMPILIATFFHICDRCSKGIPSPIILSVVMFFSIYLTNVFFTTFLITDSGILLCFIMYILPRGKTKLKAEPKKVEQVETLNYGKAS